MPRPRFCYFCRCDDVVGGVVVPSCCSAHNQCNPVSRLPRSRLPPHPLDENACFPSPFPHCSRQQFLFPIPSHHYSTAENALSSFLHSPISRKKRPTPLPSAENALSSFPHFTKNTPHHLRIAENALSPFPHYSGGKRISTPLLQAGSKEVRVLHYYRPQYKGPRSTYRKTPDPKLQQLLLDR